MADETVEQLKADLLAQQVESTRTLADANVRLREMQGEIFLGRQAELETLQSLVENAEKMHSLVEGDLETVKEKAAVELKSINKLQQNAEEMAKLSSTERAALIEQRNMMSEILALDDQQLENLQKQIALHHEQIRAKAALVSQAEKIADAVGELATVTESWKGTLVGSFLVAKTGTASFGQTIKEVGKSLRVQFNMDNIAGSAAMKLQEATLSLMVTNATAIAGFEKATSSGGQYDEQIRRMAFSNQRNGISVQESAAAYAALDSTIGGFRFMAKEAQDSMSNLVAVIEKSGVDAGIASKNINFMMGALGKTGPQAEKLTKQLYGLADSIGKSAKAIQEDFAQAASQLAHYGDQMMEVFGKISASAVALKTTVGAQLDFTSQFDQFEGAATAAARMNALLGGQYIGTVEMMQASEEERIRMTLESIEASGMQAELLATKFGPKAFAAAAGIKDMALAQTMLKQGLSGYDDMISKQNLNAASTKRMEEQASKAMDTFKMGQVILQNFAADLQPIVEKARDLLVGFSKLNDMLSGGLVPSLVFMAVVWRGIVLWKKRGLALTAAETAADMVKNIARMAAATERKVDDATDVAARNTRIGLIQAEVVAQTELNAAQTAGGVAGAAGAAKNAAMLGKAATIAAVGVALAGFGAAVYLVAEAFFTLASAFQQFDKGAGAAIPVIFGLIGAMGALAIGMLFVAKAGAIASLPLLAVGAAMLMIGGSIYLIALGFTMLGNNAIEAGLGMLAMSAGMAILAFTAAKMAIVAYLALGGFAAMAAGIAMIGLAMKTFDNNGVAALGEMFGGLGKIAKAGGVNLANMKEHVTELASLAEGMEGKKINTYIEFANATEKFGFAAEKITSPAMATKFAPGAMSAAEGPNRPGALTTAAAPGTTTGRGQAGIGKNEYTFYLQIGEHDFVPLVKKAVKQASGA